jgi:hypothetical protein
MPTFSPGNDALKTLKFIPVSCSYAINQKLVTHDLPFLFDCITNMNKLVGLYFISVCSIDARPGEKVAIDRKNFSLYRIGK